MGGKNGDLPIFSPARAGLSLIKHAPAAMDESGKLYCYTRENWQRDAAKSYRRFLVDALGEEWKASYVNETVTWIEDNAPAMDPEPPLDRVRVENGILWVEPTVKLDDHSAYPMTPISLPVRYDAKAKAPRFESYLREALPDADVRAAAEEVLGLMLIPDNTHQKAILLKGPGGNGKSVFMDVMRGLIGKDNYSAHSLQSLSENRFAAADLYGRLANICGDVSGNELSSTALFRNITGGDAISGEHKFRDGFTFVPFARLVFSANRFPAIANPTNALFDRWLVLSFDVRFRSTDDEVKGLGEILVAEELSGILNIALRGLARLRANGRFTPARKSAEALDDFRIAADVVALFIKEFGESLPERTFRPRKSLFEDFGIWCSETEHRPMSRNAFSERAEAILGPPAKVHGTLGWRFG